MMKRRGKYNKNIELDYRFIASDENNNALEEAFDLIFSKLIQDQKKLRRYLKSEEFMRLKERMRKKRSILFDYLSAH